jgi:hypothetical protein
MQISEENIMRILGDLCRSNALHLQKPCVACRRSITVEIHRTTDGYGFNGAVPVGVCDGELCFECVACQKKKSRSFR